MRIWHRIGPLLVVALVLNLISMAVAPIVTGAQDKPALTYFALGDSYASGHGLSDDNRDSDPCRRSPSSYPYRVKEALSEKYSMIKFHHLACSGATAGSNTKDKTSPFKSLMDQFDVANAYLNHRDSIANPEPVLVTITIGANDIGLKDGDTWGQISRQWPASSATNFFEWLNAKSAPVVSSLTPIIDTLLSHENVHIVLTDYPNPFKDDAAAAKIGNFFCNDMFLSLTCDEALARTLSKLNSIMLDQFLQVNQPSHLRVATLGAPFSGHYSTCLSPNPETWFGDDCVHPNGSGAQAIADAILELVPTMLHAPVVASQRTWTASVQVSLCDAPPNSGQDMNCQGVAGVAVIISLGSGEVLGSCTSGEPVQFPGGDMISLCSVDGLPFNADLVATQDPSTIPTGYVPYSNSLTLHVDDLTPGGGDQATFTFFDVRADAGSSGTTGASSGSVIEDFIVGCVPAEACYNATITITTQDGEFITSFTCPPPPSLVSSWICLVLNVPRGIPVVLTLDNIALGYVVEQNPLYWDTTIEPTAGPAGERPIFRFGTTDGSTSGASTSNESATLQMTFRACPEGFDSNTGDFFAECTIPLDAPDASIIVWGGDGQGGMNITGLDRQSSGAYTYNAGPMTMNILLSGMAPVVRDAFHVVGVDGVNGDTYTVNLVNGETREIFIFYYYE